MEKNWKEYILYPIITAVICTGINLFVDWRRGTVDKALAYVIMALIIFAGIAFGKYLFSRKKK